MSRLTTSVWTAVACAALLSSVAAAEPVPVVDLGKLAAAGECDLAYLQQTRITTRLFSGLDGEVLLAVCRTGRRERLLIVDPVSLNVLQSMNLWSAANADPGARVSVSDGAGQYAINGKPEPTSDAVRTLGATGSKTIVVSNSGSEVRLRLDGRAWTRAILD